MAEFAAEVRRFMAQRGMSLRGLARAAADDPSHLSKVLNGHKAASPYLAARLDDVLGADGKIREAAAIPPRRGPASGHGSALPRSAVTAADAEAVAETTRAFRDLDNRFGGAHAHKLAAGCLETSVAVMLRSGTYTGGCRPPAVQHGLAAGAPGRIFVCRLRVRVTACLFWPWRN